MDKTRLARLLSPRNVAGAGVLAFAAGYAGGWSADRLPRTANGAGLGLGIALPLGAGTALSSRVSKSDCRPLGHERYDCREAMGLAVADSTGPAR
jgi:hypothetical protein